MSDGPPTPRETPAAMRAVTPCEELLSLMRQLTDAEVRQLTRQAHRLLWARRQR